MSTVLNWLKTNLFVEDKTTTKERKITPKRLLIHFVAAVLVFVFIYLSYTIVKPLNNKWDTPNGAVAKAYVTILFFLLIVSYIVLYLKKANLMLLSKVQEMNFIHQKNMATTLEN